MPVCCLFSHVEFTQLVFYFDKSYIYKIFIGSIEIAESSIVHLSAYIAPFAIHFQAGVQVIDYFRVFVRETNQLLLICLKFGRRGSEIVFFRIFAGNSHRFQLGNSVWRYLFFMQMNMTSVHGCQENPLYTGILLLVYPLHLCLFIGRF